jgi:hypothetical protein
MNPYFPNCLTGGTVHIILNKKKREEETDRQTDRQTDRKRKIT